jgi:hypothetical protein
MDKQAVRRKILQGTLAAPVVLTVSSASAQAITSFGKCLGNLSTVQPTTFFTNSAAADTWFRSQVPVVEIFKGSTTQGTFYFDPKIGSYVNVVYPYTVFTGFAGATPPNSSWKLGAVSARWALVYFEPTTATPYTDAMGRTIITLQKPSGYLASSISCYGSFTKRV